MILKYAVLGTLACLIGAFISQTLGYNDGSLQAYIYAGIAGLVGGSVGVIYVKRKVKQADCRSIILPRETPHYLSVVAFALMFATMATDNMAAIFAIIISLPWSRLFFSVFDDSKKYRPIIEAPRLNIL